jgi:hypothetical protein
MNIQEKRHKLPCNTLTHVFVLNGKHEIPLDRKSMHTGNNTWMKCWICWIKLQSGVKKSLKKAKK